MSRKEGRANSKGEYCGWTDGHSDVMGREERKVMSFPTTSEDILLNKQTNISVNQDTGSRTIWRNSIQGWVGIGGLLGRTIRRIISVTEEYTALPPSLVVFTPDVTPDNNEMYSNNEVDQCRNGKDEGGQKMWVRNCVRELNQGSKRENCSKGRGVEETRVQKLRRFFLEKSMTNSLSGSRHPLFQDNQPFTFFL